MTLKKEQKLGAPQECPMCGSWQNAGLKLPEECTSCGEEYKELIIEREQKIKERLFSVWGRHKVGEYNFIKAFFNGKSISKIKALMLKDGIAEFFGKFGR